MKNLSLLLRPAPPRSRAFVAVIASTVCLMAMPDARAADSDTDRLSRLEAAVNALQAQNTELKREISSLKKEKPAKSTTTTSVAKSGDNKAVVEQTVAEKKPIYVTPGTSEAKLVLGGFIQGQYDVGDVGAYDGRLPGPLTVKTKDRFRLRRARINLTGDFLEQFDFKIEGDFAVNDSTLNVRDANGRTLANNTNRVAFSGTDIFVNWHALPEANLKLGQYKAPFGLDQLTPDTKLFFIERSQVTEALTPERQIGLMVWGKPFATVLPAQKDLLSYSAGVFNGNGRNSTTNDNNEYMYVGRLESQLYTGKIAGQDVGIKIGGDYFESRDDRGVNISQTGNLSVGRDGSLSAFTLPSADERHAYGIDGSLHIGPFDVIAEYLDERVRPRTVAGVKPGFKGFDANGYYVSGGYFVIPKKLQLVTKYESFNPGQVANDDLQSITGGLNYYFHGDDVKLLADYVHTWSDFRQHNSGFGDDQFDELFLRMQVIF